MVPSYRLRETREQVERQAHELFTQLQQHYESEVETLRNQIRALTGAVPPQNPEVQAVKDQFGNLYPGLSKLESRAERIDQLLERADEFEALQKFIWDQHRDQALDYLFGSVEKTIGSPLSDEAKQYLQAALLGYVQSSPERAERYATNSRAVVDELARAFTANFVDPVRRTSVAMAAGRVPSGLPQDTPSGAPQVTPAPKPKNMDERAQRAFAVFDAIRKGTKP
jgi:hypothetical protein